MAGQWAVWLGLGAVASLVTADSPPGCIFPTQSEYNDNNNIPGLGPLLRKSYKVNGDDGFKYQFSICSPVQDLMPDEYKFSSVVQWEVDPKDKDKVLKPSNPNILGQMNDTHFTKGSNFLMLEYRSGGNYHSHCSGHRKRSLIMIQCKKGETEGIAKIFEEQKNKTAECYYLFELEHQAACAPEPAKGLSVGTVICIVFVGVTALYLLAGFLYQRFVVGAKGVEQLPNYHFWKDFGNLQADGCDLLCRSGLKFNATGGGSREYRGIGDDQINHIDEESDHDDHLLPM